ncbi:MAG: AAA family ATPase, partial [Flavobacteriales bacterium]
MSTDGAYNAAELERLRTHYAGLKDKASYDAFVRSAHELLQRIGADPYHVRMAITRGKSMMEFGSRAAYRHSEGVGGIRVGLLMMEADVPQVPQELNPNFHYFQPRGETAYVKFTMPKWADIPPELLALNEKAMRWEYERIKDTKLVEIRRGSGTDNEALKYAVVNGVTVPELPKAIETSEQKRKQDMSIPLNRILYGPPGTGKTHHTINAAVEICDPEFFAQNEADRSKIRARFEELRVKDWRNVQGPGQIGFCTFHQSFSYEDFVEGIKPLAPIEGDTFLKYEVRPGVFKQMVDRASFHASGEAAKVKQLISLSPNEMAKAEFFKLSLGNSNDPNDQVIYDYCIEHGVIAIGFLGQHDLTGLTEQQIRALPLEQGQSRYDHTAMSYFAHYLKDGNYVIVTSGNFVVRAIGRVTGGYYYDPKSEIGYPHFRKVEWLVKNEVIPALEVYGIPFSQQTIYKLKKESVQLDFFAPNKALSSGADPAKRFVLIIDEINRGNVAGVFGELITLIEENKRKGRPEALEVTLPYSQEAFSIPDNLYLVGTMNTADRSVEALDAALRRRFSFVQMAPDPSIITPLDSTEIDLRRLLNTINTRLVQLLDEDHRIGHSHFWELHKASDPLSALRDAFADKIIPQLEEYFHRDRARLRLVLGKAFVEQVAADEKLFLNNEDMDFEPR